MPPAFTKYNTSKYVLYFSVPRLDNIWHKVSLVCGYLVGIETFSGFFQVSNKFVWKKNNNSLITPTVNKSSTQTISLLSRLGQ